jgi:hypothetical protein
MGREVQKGDEYWRIPRLKSPLKGEGKMATPSSLDNCYVFGVKGIIILS